jgi:para-nitrobenzyl esterase
MESRTNMPNRRLAVFLVVAATLGVGWPAVARAAALAPQGTAAGSDLLKRFDSNGDGALSEDERRAVRQRTQQRGQRPGAMTPSPAPQQVGNRTLTDLQYAASDGRPIGAVLSMPPGDGPFPCVVTIHGGQGDRDFQYLRTMAMPSPASPTVAALNEQPWAVLAISYRSGLFDKERDDVVAGIRFAKTLPKIDPARVGALGGSHGGHLALLAASAMGRELLCVAAGSPWMTNPFVSMAGDAAEPPLALVPEPARSQLRADGERLYQGLLRRTGSADAAARRMREYSVEANADRIVVPTLFLTSRGDDQAPHALIEPTIRRLQDLQRDVTVFTAEKCPHGFYWARPMGAARALRGDRSGAEAAEELAARTAILQFFTAQFARTNEPSAPTTPATTGARPARAVAAPSRTEAEAEQDPTARTGAKSRTRPVRIGEGQLVGEQQDGVRAFRGIRYAAPPVGDLRWRAPQPPEPWTGTREATAWGKPALQGESFFARSEQSEDCLFLNVWTPSDAAPDARLPVLVWIHGGAFIQGSGAQPRYDGSALARRGVVVVTLNYRLGPLGLFAHPALTAAAEPDEPLGNLCLLDMMAALRWTRDHIAGFGGNPENVTISGSSAGGTSCLFLLGVPAAQGLFHKAIIHSSGGIRNIQTLAQAESAGARLATHLGLDADCTPADLRRLRADDVAVGTTLLRQLGLPVKPIVDGRLVARTPAETFAAGKQARIPVLMGAANGESGARQFGDEIATGGAFGFQAENAAHMARAGQPVFLFQLTFVPPGARAHRHAAQHGESVAYAFGTIGQSTASQYGFRNPQAADRANQNRRGGERGAAGGAGREDDTLPVEDSAEARRIRDAMMDYFVAFLRIGAPEASGLPEWPAFDPDAPRAMVFGNQGIDGREFSLR